MFVVSRLFDNNIQYAIPYTSSSHWYQGKMYVGEFFMNQLRRALKMIMFFFKGWRDRGSGKRGGGSRSLPKYNVKIC